MRDGSSDPPLLSAHAFNGRTVQNAAVDVGYWRALRQYRTMLVPGVCCQAHKNDRRP